MMSIEKCRRILGEYGKKLTDEQIKRLRAILYRMVDIHIKFYKRKIRKNV